MWTLVYFSAQAGRVDCCQDAALSFSLHKESGQSVREKDLMEDKYDERQMRGGMREAEDRRGQSGSSWKWKMEDEDRGKQRLLDAQRVGLINVEVKWAA